MYQWNASLGSRKYDYGKHKLDSLLQSRDVILLQLTYSISTPKTKRCQDNYLMVPYPPTPSMGVVKCGTNTINTVLFYFRRGIL